MCVGWSAVSPGRDERGVVSADGFVSIPRPAIHTGPQHLSVDEATVEYLLEAATRVVNNRYWGSGVSALVARTLTDAAVAIQQSSPGGAS